MRSISIALIWVEIDAALIPTTYCSDYNRLYTPVRMIYTGSPHKRPACADEAGHGLKLGERTQTSACSFAIFGWSENASLTLFSVFGTLPSVLTLYGVASFPTIIMSTGSLSPSSSRPLTFVESGDTATTWIGHTG